ncbi:MAG: GNAT family N-acetyltransferase [Spirochaetia bacterium]|jgi:GNAT superfamily N-acetyltransferase|nr:GNAT family N-acetyltransferase [Spirochaetia bacterium]
MEKIRYSDRLEEMDFDRMSAMLSQAHWCQGIGAEELRISAENSSLQVGAFNEKGLQIGCARAISDKVRFAYVIDVFVDEAYRGKGIASEMMRFMLDNPSMKRVYQWFLITKDAHPLYRKVGFTDLTRQNEWMEIRRPRPDRSGTDWIKN